MSVVKGDWKLIRLFQNGEGGDHRWKLYNLAEDIGEQNDLASTQPERVKALDKLIEDYLVNTNAVVPTANPNFDATKYRLEDEGKAEPHGKNKKKPKAKTKPSPPVASWSATNDCQLALEDNALVVTSTGRDPYITSRLKEKLAPGKYTLYITMASDTSETGDVFWEELDSKPRYAVNRRVAFAVIPDGNPHTYEIEFEANKELLSIRLAPSKRPGKTSISAMELHHEDGTTVKKWDFSPPGN